MPGFAATERFDPDGHRDWVPGPPGTHFYVDRSICAQTLVDALALIDGVSAPLPKQATAGLIGTLLLACRHRNLNDMDTRATIEIYATRLAEFPADLTRKVLEDWPLFNAGFPELAALAEKIRILNWRAVAKTRLHRILEQTHGRKH